MTDLVPADSIETIVGRRRQDVDGLPDPACDVVGWVLIPTGWAEP